MSDLNSKRVISRVASLSIPVGESVGHVVVAADEAPLVEAPHAAEPVQGAVPPRTLVYTKSGTGHPLPGTDIVLCSNPSVAIAAYLQGLAVAADRVDGVPFLPQYDIPAGAILGHPRPLIVFLVTNHAIEGIPSSLSYSPDRPGVYTCRRDRTKFYKADESIVWIDSRADIKRVIKGEDKHLEVAKLLTKTRTLKDILVVVASGLRKLVRLVYSIL
jgi:hypothetical protein